MGNRRAETPAVVRKLSRWIRSRSVREKVTMGVLSGIILLILMKVYVRNRGYFFYASQIAHAAGIFVLIYKLTISKTCSGLSLRTQELTAIYLALRLISVVVYRSDVHVVLDSLTFVATVWLIYMMRSKLKSTYMAELDNMPLYYVLVPCAIVALVAHPAGDYINFVFRFLLSYWMTVEAVSVLPQLRLIQNAKMVEPFTAHYVFALGVARFFGCANWIIQLIETKGAYLMLIGHGHFWILVALVCEVVHTFILADFCYYYVKSVMAGQLVMRLPSLV